MRTPARMIWLLKAPASPRSPVTSRRARRSRVSCSLSSGIRAASLPAASAAWRVIRAIASAYGRSAVMRCSARRRRAAATISIARVIFWMFFTEAILFLTSRWDAMCAGRPSGGRGLLLGGFALLVEVVAEVLGEGLDDLVHVCLRLLRPVAAADLLACLLSLRVQAFGQTGWNSSTRSTLRRSRKPFVAA